MEHMIKMFIKGTQLKKHLTVPSLSQNAACRVSETLVGGNMVLFSELTVSGRNLIK